MLNILHAGLYTSIQDLGRFHYRNFGVPVAGVMDEYHAQLANHILGNDENDAVMEITLQGPSLLFYAAAQIAICGADLSPTLSQQSIRSYEPIPMNKPISILRDSQLNFGKRKYGVRAYLAVKGGFVERTFLKSRSYYEGITERSTITTDRLVSYEEHMISVQTKSHIAIKEEIFTNKEIHVHEGPEFHLLSEKQQQKLFNTEFTIGLNNRMAYQLEETIENNCPSIITSPVLPGTIQLTPSGKLLILMKDCQTTGGYPRILQLDEKSIVRLAQKYTKSTIQFKKLSIL
jgi:biotin-dependent carboxylase-like uncharacterized protein